MGVLKIHDDVETANENKSIPVWTTVCMVKDKMEDTTSINHLAISDDVSPKDQKPS